MSKKKRPYTEEQPIEGETIMVCVHQAISCNVFRGDSKAKERFGPNPDPERLHFFRSYFEFARPDGTLGHATWTGICHPCYQAYQSGVKYGGMPFLIGGDVVWKGNAPAIREYGPEDE